VVSYSASAGNDVTVEIDWDAVAASGFAADETRTCAAGTTCRFTSAVLRNAGTVGIAVRVSDGHGSVSTSSQQVTVNERRTTGSSPAPDTAVPQPVPETQALCANTPPKVRCQPGDGYRTPRGAKATHAGWPRITGILWKVLDTLGRQKAGGRANDQLLGHHGSDGLAGGAGDDVLWGDWSPKAGTTAQQDVLRGGAGADWIYAGRGTTLVAAGPGDDHVSAPYGRGVIDCGPGDDTVRVRPGGTFRLRGCETVDPF
jgi:Ca2+-binding RTX toxin-like protein